MIHLGGGGGGEGGMTKETHRLYARGTGRSIFSFGMGERAANMNKVKGLQCSSTSLAAIYTHLHNDNIFIIVI